MGLVLIIDVYLKGMSGSCWDDQFMGGSFLSRGWEGARAWVT